MKKSLLFSLAAVILLLSCSGGNSGKTEISWWQFWTSPDVKPTIEQMAAEFEVLNSDAVVVLGDLTWSDGHEKIAIALASGEGPDVIELGSDWIAEFAAEGKLLDITENVAGMVDRLQMWGPATYEGKIYGVPWMLGTRVLFCNRSLLNAAGFPGDFVPSTWDQMLEAAMKVNNLGPDKFGFGSNSAERHRLYKKFLPFFWTAGGRVFSEDSRTTLFDSAEGRKALEFYLALSESGLIETQSRLEEYFAAGDIAFVISGEWLIRRMSENPVDFDFFVTTMPGIEEDEIGSSFAGGEYLVINSDSKNMDLAFNLISHLTLPENDIRFAESVGSFTPVNKSNALNLSPEMSSVATVFQYQLSAARSTPVHPQWVLIEEIIEGGVEQAIYGKMTASEALKFIDAECSKVLAQDPTADAER